MSKSGNLAALSAILHAPETPTIYYAEDPPYLPRILVFYWPVQAVGSLASTSRIKTTILSAAGFKSFPPFSIAPSSSYYSAVHKLPDDKQRDDVSRGIAFALFRYFSEVPAEVKNAIMEESLQGGAGLKWGQTHAAQVTCRMNKVINTDEVLQALKAFSKDRPATPPIVSSPARPVASIRKTRPSFLPADNGHGGSRYGQTMTPGRRIPSSGARRTPSSSTPTTRKTGPTPVQKQTAEQLESLRFKMCEFVDTEDRYIVRVQELIDMIALQGRTPKSLSSKFSNASKQKTVDAMSSFPSLLDQIKDLNVSFLDDIEAVLQSTEDSALAFLDSAGPQVEPSQLVKDPIGVYAFSKVMLNHFPKLTMPYREYLDLHSIISSNLDQYLKDGTTSIQKAPSLLMEPAQRISRYGLYIDTMLPHIPQTSTMAIRTLEKSRKIINEICEMEPAASAILDSLRIEHESRRRAYSPTKLLSSLTRTNGSVREAPALSGSLNDRQGPKLFHSIGRSLSRKNTKSRPGLRDILSEQDPANINNAQPQFQVRNDENRPFTSSSGNSYSSFSKRPTTASSAASGRSTQKLALESIPSLPPTPSDKLAQSSPTMPAVRESEAPPAAVAPTAKMATLEHYKAALMRVEEENYKLLQENADLKRQIRECKCKDRLR